MKLGVRFFEIFEFTEELVVVRVRNFGCRVLIVKTVMATDFPAEVLDTIVKKHGQFLREAGGFSKEFRSPPGGPIKLPRVYHSGKIGFLLALR